jgi:hypothetical protein
MNMPACYISPMFSAHAYSALALLGDLRVR